MSGPGPLQFVWGPPGTGKTRTLAQLAAQLLQERETVLLTANTNVAVDRLVGSTLDALGSPEEPPVLRVGRIGAALRGRGASAEERLAGSREVGTLAAALGALLRTAGVSCADDPDIDTILRLAGWVTTAHEVLTGQVSAQTVLELLELAAALLRAVSSSLDVPIMAATLCGTYTRPELRARRFDTVIVDEASMASVAHFTAPAALARKRVVIAGDFQQLPPIVLADTPEARRFLGHHMFAFTGCDDVESDHPLRAMLREQWRMHPEIRLAVSRVFYADRLVDAAAVAHRARSNQGGMLVLDTHGCAPRTHRTPSRSIRDPVHARQIAEWLTGCGWEIARTTTGAGSWSSASPRARRPRPPGARSSPGGTSSSTGSRPCPLAAGRLESDRRERRARSRTPPAVARDRPPRGEDPTLEAAARRFGTASPSRYAARGDRALPGPGPPPSPGVARDLQVTPRGRVDPGLHRPQVPG